MTSRGAKRARTHAPLLPAVFLVDQVVDRTEQASSIRIVAPGVQQHMIQVYSHELHKCMTEEELKAKVFSLYDATLNPANYLLQIHVRSCGLVDPSFTSIADAGLEFKDGNNWRHNLKWMQGSKVRLVPSRQRRGKSSLQMRAITARSVLEFHTKYPGHNSRAKQELLAKSCPEGLSWVEWQASADAGAPDAMISYSWDLNWEYLVSFIRGNLSPNTRIWIDILACDQCAILRGEMDEIKQLPEVINFAGKTIAMPGTVKRLWCCYEFGWCMELNSGCLFYGYDGSHEDGIDEAAHASQRMIADDVRALVQQDKEMLQLPGTQVMVAFE